LLPVHPTPTTYARFGRFGSPYAALDLTAVDPALVEFDKRTTGIDQFCELTYAAHSLGARVFIDIVINHTGWGSTLQENHPEFFLKNPDGEFASPGAWGTVWEDLVELEQHDVKLWDLIADSLLTWCRRGVDGFRCDAGYKIPAPAWQYIVARVQEEFPETIFLLEGLGGSWDATERCSPKAACNGPIPSCSKIIPAATSRGISTTPTARANASAATSLFRNARQTPARQKRPRVVAAAQPPLRADQSERRLRLHLRRGMAGGGKNPRPRQHRFELGRAENIVPELAQLNRLISDHPCFFDGAKLTRLSAPDSPVYALLRESAEGKDSVLVLVNTDVEKEKASRSGRDFKFQISDFKFDLLGQPLPKISAAKRENHFHARARRGFLPRADRKTRRLERR
jgi:starch synthase (maltosyl-transferring)